MEVEDLIPQVAAGKFTAKVIGALCLGVAAAAAAGWVFWKLFLADGSAKAEHDQIQTQAVIGTAQAGQKSAAEAVKIVIDNSKANAGIDAAVGKALDAISKIKGADQQLDPALDSAGRAAICLRASAASLLACQPVQQPSP